MIDTLPHPKLNPEDPDPYRNLRTFVVAVLLVGAVRFVLTVSGTDDSIARWASMTGVITLGLIYFAWRQNRWKQRMVISYVLIAPYMVIETVGLGYTWASGTTTIFHAEAYNLGAGLEAHFWGHIVGGLTWEPWFVFLLTSLLAWLFRMTRRALC